MGDSTGFGFRRLAWTVAIYAFAMAYLESAVVVYLQRALSMTPSTLFPLRDQATLGGLGSIEVGREVATIVMLAAVGWLADQFWNNRSPLSYSSSLGGTGVGTDACKPWTDFLRLQRCPSHQTW